jgi:hypothetical protein
MDYSKNVNYARGTTQPGGGMNLAGLYALYLLQPQANMDPRNARVVASGKEISIREETTAALAANHVFFFHSIRQFTDKAVGDMSKLYGGLIPMQNPSPVRRGR